MRWRRDRSGAAECFVVAEFAAGGIEAPSLHSKIRRTSADRRIQLDLHLS
jgi:hypothetical protein